VKTVISRGYYLAPNGPVWNVEIGKAPAPIPLDKYPYSPLHGRLLLDGWFKG